MPQVPATLDWLFTVIAIVLAIGALVVFVRALFRDRARGRYRCQRCWYDLTAPEGGAPSLPITCSECGRVTRKLRRLRRTRRRWGRALGGVVLLAVGGAVAFYPQARRDGPWSIVPTRFLVDSMPVFGYPSIFTDELLRRHGLSRARPGPLAGWNWNQTPRLSIEDHIYLADRVARGNWLARPTSARWQRTFGRFHLDVHTMLFDLGFGGQPQFSMHSATDPRLRAAIEQLYEIPLQVRFRTRPVWPEGCSLYVQCDASNWWPWPTGDRIVARDLVTDEWHEASNPYGFVVDGLAGKGEGKRRFEVRVQWIKQANEGSQWSDRQQFLATVPYRIEGRIDQIITPVIDPALDQLIAGSEYGAMMRADGRLPCTRTRQTEGLAFGVIVDYLLDGVVQATERAWWPGGVATHPMGDSLGSDWIDGPRFPAGSTRRSPWLAKPGENWTVHIRSDPETALRVIDADKYWQGDVTIPMAIR